MTLSGSERVLRFFGIADFTIGPSRGVRVDLDPRQAGEMASALLGGTVSAFLLSLSGTCVLHASAVEVNGRAIGFVAPSGGGKSTMAACCCADGARLVADDLLAIEQSVEGVRCAPAAAPIRLARSFARLADAVLEATVGRTIDGRLAVRVRRPEVDSLPLACLVLLRPAPAHAPVTVRRLDRLDAVYELARCLRIASWCAAEPLRRGLDHLGRLVAAVPVFHAEIPWQASVSRDAAMELLRRTA